MERDFKTEYLFRTCSVATNLVTSLEFNPVPCATMLCHFGQRGNGSVATHFIHFGSTAKNSATGEYAAPPERIVQNEEPPCGNEKRTRIKTSFAPNST